MRLGLRIPSVLMVLIRPFLQRRGRFNAPPHIFKKFVENSVGSWQGWDLLPEITTPTLVIAGQRDWYVRPSLSRRTAYEMPRARLEIIRAAGHQSPLETAGGRQPGPGTFPGNGPSLLAQRRGGSPGRGPRAALAGSL